MADPTGLAKLADSQLVNKAYDDLLADAMKEGGQALVDTVKAIRLFTAPIQLLAVAQDRLKAFCEKVWQRVPEERQVEAPPSIAIPVLLSLRYMEDDNPLTELYLNLLARAIDKERQGEAHPAFARIIEQLSPDEAQLLYDIKGEGSRVIRDLRPPKATWWLKCKDEDGRRVLDTERIACPEHLLTYFGHLAALNLVVVNEWTSRVTIFSLDPFGRLFVNACIPEDFKLPKSSSDDSDTET